MSLRNKCSACADRGKDQKAKTMTSSFLTSNTSHSIFASIKMTSEQEPANPEPLPEDIIPMIVEYIRSWADLKVVGADAPQRREIARKWVSLIVLLLARWSALALEYHWLGNRFTRSRDSALHAWALSSKENHRRVLPHLLQDVTLTTSSLGTIHDLVIERPLVGSFVRTLKLHWVNDDERGFRDLALVWNSYSEHYGKELSKSEMLLEILRSYLLRWPNIHTLILAGELLSIPLVNHQRKPFHCLTFSLKRLWVGSAVRQLDRMMNGTSGIFFFGIAVMRSLTCLLFPSVPFASW